MLTAEMVKKAARAAGADIVAVGPTTRFEGAPLQMDPRTMLPSAKSVIAMGFRHPRGVFRGIEEGTFFTAYSAMGYASINFVYQPYVLYQVGRLIEDHGYDVMPLPNNFPWTNTESSGVRRERIGKHNPTLSIPPGPDKPAPNVFIQLRLAAFCAGLGEIGFSKMFLSPEFGPRQRLAVILTDAELEADPLLEPGTICDRCMACVKACSAKAMPVDDTVQVTVAGRDLEWSNIDMAACGTGFCGGAPSHNPFAVTEADRERFGDTVGKAQQHKLKPVYVYARALEGAAGCIRACMIHLEQTGRIANRFENRFRKRPTWRMQW